MRKFTRIAVFVASLITAQSALAQGLVWKFVQPWTARLAAHTSRVQTCTNPVPLPQIAADDWVCGATGPIIRIEWWGTLSDPAQAKRPFYVAFYSTLATACLPNLAQPIFQTCVVPDYCKQVGTDCQNRKVYKLSAPFTGPIFSQVQGTHYWVQISEADAESIRPGQEDFRWSSHRAVMNCPAISAFPVTQPIMDACDQQPEDLAFGLASRTITITVNPGISTALLRILDPSSSELLESFPLEFDPDGHAVAIPELPDGMYIMELKIDGRLKQRIPAQLANGNTLVSSFFDVFYGDANGDAAIDLGDLSQVLSNYGKMGPP